MTGICLTIQRILTTAIFFCQSDITFTGGRNIDILRGDSDIAMVRIHLNIMVHIYIC